MPEGYDFAAADRLDKALSQLVDKLDWLIWLRSTQRKTLLGTSHSDNWQGAKREDSDQKFSRQQGALIGLKERARHLQMSVSDATATAHASQKPEPGGGRAPTPRPGTSPTPPSN